MDIVTPGAANLWLFVSAALVLLLVPGPAVLYIFARSVEQGRTAGFVSILGILFAVLGSITDGCYALAAGTMGNWLKGSRGYLKVERYVSGVLFIGLGLTAAFTGSQKK